MLTIFSPRRKRDLKIQTINCWKAIHYSQISLCRNRALEPSNAVRRFGSCGPIYVSALLSNGCVHISLPFHSGVLDVLQEFL